MHTQKQKGFTIVELLIVIVVIGILAAVTIVAYTGISKKATAAALQTDLEGASKTLENDKTIAATSAYPANLAAANSGKGLIASNGAGYQYTVDNTANPKVYCLTVTKGSTSYYIDQTGVIQSGYCNGQVSPANNTAIVTTLAGSSTTGYVDATGTAAQFGAAFYGGIVADSSGNVFVMDRNNHVIRKITPAGVVTTFVGSGTSGTADGTGTAAQLVGGYGMAIDSSNTLYVSDSARIRKITSGGVVTTLAGSTSGFADATGTSAKFKDPEDMSIDSSGNLYVADYANSRIRKVTPAGVVTTIAGQVWGYADGIGTNAQFANPSDVTIDNNGNLYVMDDHNYSIRKIQIP